MAFHTEDLFDSWILSKKRDSQLLQISQLIVECVDLYFKANSLLLSASACFLSSGRPLLAGPAYLISSEEKKADQAVIKGRDFLSEMEDVLDELLSKKHSLHEEVLERRRLGIELSWISPEAKQRMKDLSNKASESVHIAKEARALSIKIEQERTNLLNMLKSYGLL